MFDTLDYSEALTDAGVPADQAILQAKALSEALESNDLATKVDIARLEATMAVMDSKFVVMDSKFTAKLDAMDSKFVVMDSKFTAKLDAMDSKFDVMDSQFDVMAFKFTASMSEMRFEFIKWGAGMVFALSGIMFALLRFMLP